MHNTNSQQRPRPGIDKRRVRPEDGREPQLEHGPGQGSRERHAGVREAELVEVVEVRQAEDYGTEEDDLADGCPGEQHEGDGGGAEEDFLCDRPGDEVAPGRPFPPDLGQGLRREGEPEGGAPFDDEGVE